MKNRYDEIRKARKLLGISKNAAAEDAKQKYRELAKMWHPDMNSTEEAHSKMQDINKAFALLMKEEFGILDPREEANRWWWERFGDDPIWGKPFPEEEEKPQEPKKRKNLIGNEG